MQKKYLMVFGLIVVIGAVVLLRIRFSNTDIKKFCNSSLDCAAVSCSCGCSGCGGFSYEEIVNLKYQSEWYKSHNCQPATVCPMVCCPKARIACVNHQCTVKKGESGANILRYSIKDQLMCMATKGEWRLVGGGDYQCVCPDKVEEFTKAVGCLKYDRWNQEECRKLGGTSKCEFDSTIKVWLNRFYVGPWQKLLNWMM